MIVSGLPERNGNNHANEIAKVALELLDGVNRFQIPHKRDEKLQIRIGNIKGLFRASIKIIYLSRFFKNFDVRVIFFKLIQHSSFLHTCYKNII